MAENSASSMVAGNSNIMSNGSRELVSTSDIRSYSSGPCLLESSPLVSVIIPNYNGRHHLKNCFPSIVGQSYRNLELVLVDNGSTDGSVEFAKTAFSRGKFVCNTRNLGFAAAVNQGLRASSGMYVLILNNDTVLEPDFVQVLVDTMRKWKERRGSNVIGLAPKMQFSGRPIIDSIGNAINPDGSAFNVGIGQVDLGQFDMPMRVFGLCFAAAFIERFAFDRVGFLDESYFAYYEDVDWCYRANVFGFEFYSAPRALVHHHHSGSARTLMTSDQKYYLIHRNFLRTVIKNYFRGNLIRAARIILIHIHQFYQNLRIWKFRKAWLHAKILAVTLIWLPLLLARNVGENRRRIATDSEIWGISSERIVQISGSTFDPETYSPLVTLDVMEETFQHLAFNVGRKEYLEAYFSVHTINCLRKQSFFKISPRSVRGLTMAVSKNKSLRVKGVLGYRIGHMVFIMHRQQSYVVDQFLLNLILVMNGRTLEEVATVLLENAFTERQRSDRGEAGAWYLQPVVTGLRWIAAYLAKLGLIEGDLGSSVESLPEAGAR